MAVRRIEEELNASGCGTRGTLRALAALVPIDEDAVRMPMHLCEHVHKTSGSVKTRQRRWYIRARGKKKDHQIVDFDAVK